jgi:DNA-binding NtrC family response regulator
MVAKPRILVVDDEPVVRESLHDWFTEDGYPNEMASNAREALDMMRDSHWDILLTDVKMPGMDGLELQKKAKEIDPDVTVIIMTAYASVDSALQAIKEGAYDYVTKPLDPDDLEQIINRAAERRQLLRENVELRERIEATSGETDAIIGESQAIQKVRELIAVAADHEDPVLIIGESGTGKQLVARTIHRTSSRHHMPMLTIQCAGTEEHLLESELFGYEPGAFPGADVQQRGKLELADGGTAFVENIGDLNRKVQIVLQRVLREKTLTRIGGGATIPVDFRLIATTTRDLAPAAEGASFERDLYQRIAGCAIGLPPLRERRSDVVPLARHFLEISARETGGQARRISAAAEKLLMDYAWPGNVRELRAIMERATMLERDEEILPEDLRI